MVSYRRTLHAKSGQRSDEFGALQKAFNATDSGETGIRKHVSSRLIRLFVGLSSLP